MHELLRFRFFLVKRDTTSLKGLKGDAITFNEEIQFILNWRDTIFLGRSITSRKNERCNIFKRERYNFFSGRSIISIKRRDTRSLKGEIQFLLKEKDKSCF